MVLQPRSMAWRPTGFVGSNPAPTPLRIQKCLDTPREPRYSVGMALTKKEKAERYERMVERRKAYYQNHREARLKYQKALYYKKRSVKKPRKEAPSGS